MSRARGGGGTCSKIMSGTKVLGSATPTFSFSTAMSPSLEVSLKISSPSISRPEGRRGTRVRAVGIDEIIEMNEV